MYKRYKRMRTAAVILAAIAIIAAVDAAAANIQRRAAVVQLHKIEQSYNVVTEQNKMFQEQLETMNTGGGEE